MKERNHSPFAANALPARRAVGAFALLIILAGCKYLSMEPLRVTRVSPDSGVVDTDGLDRVEVFFSSEADRALTEGAFSLLEDGIEMEGSVSWPSGDCLSFAPYAAFKRTKTYRIKVTTEAEDAAGNSLKEDFIHDFRASADSTRPTLSMVRPATGSAVALLRPAIELTFSEPMDVTSVINALRLSPDSSGYVVDSGDSTTFTYALTEDLKWQTLYTIEVADAARDKAGNSLGKTEKRNFFTGTESVSPAVLSVTDIDSGFALPPDSLTDGAETVTSGVNRTDRLRVQFTEPMDRDSVEKSITLTPSARYLIEWDGSGDALTLKAEPGYDYGSLIAIAIAKSARDLSGNELAGEALYKFRVTGARSKPPHVSSAYFLNGFDGSGFALASGLLRLEPIGTFAFADRYSTRPTGSGTVTGFFDVYLDLADGAGLDLTAFLESFSVTVKNASITPFACQIDGDITFMTSLVPVNGGVPLPANRHVARYIVHVNNWDSSAANIPGFMTVSLDAKFADSLGNTLSSAWSLTACTTN